MEDRGFRDDDMIVFRCLFEESTVCFFEGGEGVDGCDGGFQGMLG